MINRRCRVYRIRSLGSQKTCVVDKLRKIWTEENPGRSNTHFPQPSSETIDELRHLFPLQELLSNGNLIGFQTLTDDDMNYPIAIVADEHGFLDYFDLPQIQILEEGML